MKRKLKAALGDELMRKFIGKSFLAFAIKISSAGLSFLMFVAIARAVGKEHYGIFGAAFSLATFMAVAGSLGQRPTVLRFAGGYDEKGEHELRRGVTQRGYRLVTGGCLLTAAITVLYYGFGTEQVGPSFIAAVVLLTLAIGLAEFQSFVLRITAGIALALVPRDIVWRVFVCLAAGWALFIFGGGQAYSPEHWLWFLGVTLLILVLGQFVLHERRAGLSRIMGPVQQDRASWNQPVRDLWLSSMTMTGATTLGVVMIERLVSPEEAGPFFSAMRTAQLLNLLLLAASVICGPMLSRAIANGDWKQVQKVSTITSAISGGFGLLGYLLMVVAGHWLLGLFGPGFEVARPELLVIGLGFVVNTAAGPTGPLLEMGGKERAYFQILLIFNGIGLLSMPVTISLFGAMGAALSTAFASIGWNVAAVVYARARLGIDPSVLALVLPASGRASQR